MSTFNRCKDKNPRQGVIAGRGAVRRCFLTFLVVVGMVSGVALAEQLPCEVQKLIPSHANMRGLFGWALDMAGDVLVVGAPSDDDVVKAGGATFVFGRDAGVWSEKAEITPSAARLGDYFGFAVAATALLDGSRIVVGAPYRQCEFDEINCGAAFIFEKSGETWTQVVELHPDNIDDEQFFGGAVAIDGNRVVVGAPSSNGGLGFVYVFEFDGSSWQKTSKITAPPTGWFGSSVALDGDRLVIGAQRDSERGGSAGAVFVYQRAGSTWQFVQKLTATDAMTGDNLGISIALDGDTVLAGASFRVPGVAYAFQYDESTGTWSQAQKLLPDDSHSGDGFGSSVTVRGALAGVGTVGNGAFLYDTESWLEVGHIPQTQPGDAFGFPVHLTDDLLFVSAHYDDNPLGNCVGAVHVFLRSSILWGLVNVGDGSPPADVLFVNGTSGDSCRHVDVSAGDVSHVTIHRAPSGNGSYALWIYDTDLYAGAPIEYQKGSTLYELGIGVKPLPINNTVTPGSVACPVTFPIGWTSQSLGVGRAASFCLNSRPGFPRAPTSFSVTFPAGNYIIGGVVKDRNSINSPTLDISIANWLYVSAR